MSSASPHYSHRSCRVALKVNSYFSYKDKIHRTFSGGSFFPLKTPYIGNVSLTAAASVRSRGFPTPIFVTSASAGAHPPPRGHIYTLGDVFELSPTVIGGPNLGYYDASSEFGKWIDTGDAVAMSAAAIDTPQGKIQLPAIAKSLDFGLSRHFYAPDARGGTSVFTLEDGGFIDNLGVMPLLRRGCTSILAFDNSDDEYPFDAWNSLKTRIASNEESGWRVTKDLQSRNLHLTAPSSNAHESVAECASGFWKWQLPAHLWQAELENGDQHVHLVLVKLGIDKTHLERYPASVQAFARANWATTGQPVCRGTGLHRKCSFPVEATARQSYTPDEFKSYRQLGSWLGELAVLHPETDGLEEPACNTAAEASGSASRHERRVPALGRSELSSPGNVDVKRTFAIQQCTGR
jgi:hypothetical protein